MAQVIDQTRNYAADFGAIYRSSGIFYKPKGVKLTISVSDYWSYKNNLSVGLVVTERTMDGKVVSRRPMDFSDSYVLNLGIDGIEEGSVEIEAFSSKNLRIPYAAIMGIYETPTGISMVHTYGRNHSLIELEDGNSITEGRESCWRIRHQESIDNFAVFHNGHLPTEPQAATLILTDVHGTDTAVEFGMPALRPFETFVFSLREIYPQYHDALGDSDGWATVHFQNASSFTRLLVMWRDIDNGEIQVTHSNFDYSSHRTNLLKSDKPAIMKLPEIVGATAEEVVVYPKFNEGSYRISVEDDTTTTTTGLFLPVKPKDKVVTFRRDDGDLPSRIVTGFAAALDNDALPFECSLGVAHEKRPPKRFHWMVVSRKYKSRVMATDFREIYGEPENGIKLVFSLYNAFDRDIARVEKAYDSLDQVPKSLALDEIFGGAEADLQDAFGYVSVFSEWGGFMFYSSLEKNHALTIEHSF